MNEGRGLKGGPGREATFLSLVYHALQNKRHKTVVSRLLNSPVRGEKMFGEMS